MNLPFERSNSRGFVLLDAMIAFAVLSVVVVAIYTISIRAAQHQAKAARQYEETALARSILEEYIVTYPDFPRSGHYKGRWSWKIREAQEPVLRETEIDHLFQFVRVTVEVQAMAFVDQSTLLSTVVARRGDPE